SVSGSIVIEQLIVCSDLLIYFVHVLLYHRRKSVVVGVAGLSCLEEDIRVLGGTSLAGMVGIQSVFSESVHRVHIYHIFQIFVIPGLDLLDLVGSTESVKEVDEGNFALDRCQMGNRSQIHNFLYGRLTQHSNAGLAACVYIGMVAENRQSVAGQSTGGYVEHTRQLLAGDLVQIRDHQQKSLRSRVGGGQSACGKRTVYSACSACLGLHLSDLHFMSENVLSPLGSPLIGSFCHGR